MRLANKCHSSNAKESRQSAQGCLLLGAQSLPSQRKRMLLVVLLRSEAKELFNVTVSLFH